MSMQISFYLFSKPDSLCLRILRYTTLILFWILSRRFGMYFVKYLHAFWSPFTVMYLTLLLILADTKAKEGITEKIIYLLYIFLWYQETGRKSRMPVSKPYAYL